MQTSGKLERLVHAYLEGVLDENEAAELNEMVKTSPGAARRLAQMSFDHAQFGDIFATRPQVVPVSAPAATKVWTSRRILAAASAAAAVIVVAVTLLLISGGTEVAPEDTGNQAVKPFEEKKIGDVEVASGDETQEPAAPGEEEALVENQPGPQEPRQAPDEQPEVLACLGSASGDVKVRRAGSDQWEEVEVLFCLLPGDSIMTGPEGAARIDFENGDSAYVNAGAQMTVSEEKEEVVLGLEKGEVYLEKESEQKAIAVETGFGRARSRRGRFHMRRLSRRRYMLHVLEGEVECHERGTGSRKKYGPRMQAWMQQGEGFGKGEKFDSEDAFGWARKMRRRRAGQGPGPGRGPGPKGPGGPMRPGRGPGRPGGSPRPGRGPGHPERPQVPEEMLPERLIQKFDTDGDGKLSEEERRAAREAMKALRDKGKGGNEERPSRTEPERPGGRKGPGQGQRKPGPGGGGRRGGRNRGNGGGR
jgi:ferric-dicitrate binding protein FerR (iron transport regulator)